MAMSRNYCARASLMIAVSTMALAGVGAVQAQSRQFNVPAQPAATPIPAAPPIAAAPAAPAMRAAAIAASDRARVVAGDIREQLEPLLEAQQ